MNQYVNEHSKLEWVSIGFKAHKDKFYINMKSTMTLNEINEFVSFVVEQSFDENENYNPVCRRIAFYTALLKYLTDIPLPMLNEEAVNADRIYDIVNELNLLDEFYKLNPKLYSEINEYIEDALCYTQSKQRRSNKIDDLINKIFDVISKLDEGVDLNLLKNLLPKLAEMELDEKKLAQTILDYKYGKAESL